MEKPNCLLCSQVVDSANARYRLIQRDQRGCDPTLHMTKIGEALEKACGQRIPAGLPEFVCRCCRNRILKIEQKQEELDRAKRKLTGCLHRACRQYLVGTTAADSQTRGAPPSKRFLSPSTSSGVSPVTKRCSLRPSPCTTQPPPSSRRELFPTASGSAERQQQKEDEEAKPRLLLAPSPDTPCHSSRIPIRVRANIQGVDVTCSVKVCLLCPSRLMNKLLCLIHTNRCL